MKTLLEKTTIIEKTKKLIATSLPKVHSAPFDSQKNIKAIFIDQKTVEEYKETFPDRIHKDMEIKLHNRRQEIKNTKTSGDKIKKEKSK